MMWDFDRRLYEQIIYFDQNCWPVKRIATHICCTHQIFVKNINFILNGMTNKDVWVHRLVHDVPKSQLLDGFFFYYVGIQKDTLPTEMGGTILFDQLRWIASQRAEELKEIWLPNCGSKVDTTCSWICTKSRFLWGVQFKFSALHQLTSVNTYFWQTLFGPQHTSTLVIYIMMILIYSLLLDQNDHSYDPS